jgi:hypothetical protein
VALDVLRSVKAGVWEGTDMELLQVEGIGSAKMNKLVEAGVTTIKQLSRMEFFHIERLLSRNPPFGHEILQQVSHFPKLTLQFEGFNFIGEPNNTSTTSRSAAKLILGLEGGAIPIWKKKHPWMTLVIEGEDGRLVWFWRGSVKRLIGDLEMTIQLEVKKNEEVTFGFACEEIVGTMLRRSCRI